jgi:hypothetical protein
MHCLLIGSGLQIGERAGDLVEFPRLLVTLATTVLALTPAGFQVVLGLVEVTSHRMLTAPALINLAFVMAAFLVSFGACSANWS